MAAVKILKRTYLIHTSPINESKHVNKTNRLRDTIGKYPDIYYQFSQKRFQAPSIAQLSCFVEKRIQQHVLTDAISWRHD